MKSKEIQEILIKQNIEKVGEEEFFSILKIIAPGTNFRLALDGALKTGKGALIVVENSRIPQILNGGFRINCRFTSQKLIELSKMDGAIILSKDMKKINYANVLLTPDSFIKTSETGTRHIAAERTAKQAGTLAIAISERRSEIKLYYKNMRYLLQNTTELLAKASEHIQMLEKQRELFDSYIEKLNKSEIQRYSNLNLAVTIIQRGKLIQGIIQDLKKYVVELGKEGTLLKIRLKEIKGGVERETDLVVKDYTNLSTKKTKIIIDSLSYEEILIDENITEALAYDKDSQTFPIKGWRLLSKTSISDSEIAKIVEKNNLRTIIQSSFEKFTPILGEEKSRKFKDEIDKMIIGLKS